MLNRLGLDETAASRSKRQQLDHLLKATAPHELVVLAGIGLMLLSLLAWSLFGSMENGITTDCTLIKSGARYDVVSSEPGQLLEYLVVPGEQVEANAGIARQSVPELAREIAALRERVDRLERERDALRAGGKDEKLSPLLDSARVAVLEMEALRSARETIVALSRGEIMALQSVPGSYLLAGTPIAQIRSVSDAEAWAVLAATPHMARRIRPGMRAVVDVSTHEDGTRVLHGEVASVTDGPLPYWLADFLSTTEDTLHRVDIAFDPAPSLADGTACRARIILGQSSPVALLGFGRF